MIWESEYWKKDILKTVKKLEKRTTEEVSERSLVDIEGHFCFVLCSTKTFGC